MSRARCTLLILVVAAERNLLLIGQPVVVDVLRAGETEREPECRVARRVVLLDLLHKGELAILVAGIRQ